jgi:predicted signal transduction protein with EAL and GGDEF domain
MLDLDLNEAIARWRHSQIGLAENDEEIACARRLELVAHP